MAPATRGGAGGAPGCHPGRTSSLHNPLTQRCRGASIRVASGSTLDYGTRAGLAFALSLAIQPRAHRQRGHQAARCAIQNARPRARRQLYRKIATRRTRHVSRHARLCFRPINKAVRDTHTVTGHTAVSARSPCSNSSLNLFEFCELRVFKLCLDRSSGRQHQASVNWCDLL